MVVIVNFEISDDPPYGKHEPQRHDNREAYEKNCFKRNFIIPSLRVSLLYGTGFADAPARETFKYPLSAPEKSLFSANFRVCKDPLVGWR